MFRLLLVTCTLASSAVAGADDVQRQLQERARSQNELRLKMEQQFDRAARPPVTPAEELRRGLLERAQAQRLRALQEERSRSAAVPAEHGGVGGEIARQRAEQAAAEELSRFESERRREMQRSPHSE